MNGYGPHRQSRSQIERELAKHLGKHRFNGTAGLMRGAGLLGLTLEELTRLARGRRRRPRDGGMAVPAIPPRGPLPLSGGAEAPLEFDD
jgi:hypothetical protein